MAAINKVECKDQRFLIQISPQIHSENTIMKENSTSFKLACSSPSLHLNLVHYLGNSKEGLLS